jgi:uncharacterized membrane protein
MFVENAILVVAATLTALVAGLFFAFSVAVNGALHRLSDLEYVRAMQSINIVILNPVFLMTFFGPVFLLPLAAYLFLNLSVLRFALLAVAALLYVVGAFGVTIAGSVPLNNRLARFETVHAWAPEVATARREFERPWNRLHAVRTVASAVATVLLFAAAVAR